MATNPSIFPLSHITLTSAITTVVALLVMFVMRRGFKGRSLAERILVAAVVGFSVLAWRAVGNTAALNNDPIPGVSPNDVLCPLVTYLFLGMYAAFSRPMDAARWEQARVWLALVSFLINVVTI
jgi:hypothetical protein